MITSGTYAFAMSRDDLIAAALRKTTKFASGDTIPDQDILDCAQALNVLCKSMVTEGLPLWCVQEYTIPLVAEQASYDVSAATGMQRPPRILDAFVRTIATSNDVSIALESRYDYNALGQKTGSGVPNQGYYDSQLGAATITLYNVPQDALQELHIVVQRQLQDINLSTQNPDFPQEAYRMLVWNLADEISLEYSVPADVRGDIAARALVLRNAFFSFEQEQVSIQFTPSSRSR